MMLQLEAELFTLRRMIVDSDDNGPFFYHGPNDMAPIEGAPEVMRAIFRKELGSLWCRRAGGA